MAVGSFASVSLEPPLVAFFAGRSSSTWPRIEAAGSFCVNILAEDQEGICRRFASKEDDKFAGIAWHQAGSGYQLLGSALRCRACYIDSVVESVDPVCVVGRVRAPDDHDQ